MIDHALLICAVSLTEHKTILQLERLAKFMKEQFMLEILQNYQSLESSKTLSVPGTRVICMCFLIILMAPFSYLSSHHSPSLIPLTTSIPLTPIHTTPHYHFSLLPLTTSEVTRLWHKQAMPAPKTALPALKNFKTSESEKFKHFTHKISYSNHIFPWKFYAPVHGKMV